MGVMQTRNVTKTRDITMTIRVLLLDYILNGTL